MLAHRSLLAVWQQDQTHWGSENDFNFTTANDCFWAGGKMNEPAFEASPLSANNQTFAPSPSPTNMTQSDRQTEDSPQYPTTIKSQGNFLPPTSDYDRMFRKFHQHNTSDSTITTASNDSSPTTTISTVDDSSATEPSPGSSPESPPPTSFPVVGMLRPRTADGGTQHFFELQKQPPPRKERNMKRLAVNTSRQPGKAASTTLLPLQSQSESTTTVLSTFVKPPTPRKRKPNNLGLTIMTPANHQDAPQEIRLAIPPTPAFSRPGLLRHFQSSPSLPVVSGLSLQERRPVSRGQPPVLDTIFSPVEVSQSPAIEEADEEQNFDIPLSREEKPEAYPDGPICVYEPYVDLYLEPTAEQARQYDVVFNVANEVRNPFVEHSPLPSAEPDLRLDGGGGIQYAPKRDHLKAGDVSVNGNGAPYPSGSPTTPKATPLTSDFPSDATAASSTAGSSQNDPEYIHIPWDHNSDIVPDLLRLGKLIDEKVAQGKRVLIHCQCGVSRSASLIVAYGLYKNPSMSVQEAYDAVKKRSKWIGPNMNLIMQLQEFRTSLARGGALSGNRALSPLTPGSALSEWNGPFSQRQAGHDIPSSAGVAPLSGAATTDNLPPITPGPSSAPSGFSWSTARQAVSQRPRAVSAVKATTAYVDPSGHVLPVLSIVDADRAPQKTQLRPSQAVEHPKSIAENEPQVASPRSTEFAMAPLQPPPAVDAADSFGIMSPTAAEFSSSPFDRSALLASLGMGSMRADEETPRRSLSLRSRSRPIEDANSLRVNGQPGRRLRTKISSPTLREQQQLQSLQAKIEASLPNRPLAMSSLNTVDEALMSPRATEFTSNPFALAVPIQGFKTPPQQTAGPTSEAAAQETGADPRSPAQKGASPIIRNIWDFL